MWASPSSPGEPLHATNRLFWAALLLIGAFCFFHILINPASGYLSSSARTPLLTMVILFVAFGLLSVAFWAYFRINPSRAEPGARRSPPSHQLAERLRP